MARSPTTSTHSANRSGSIGLSVGQNSGVTVSGAAGRGQGQTTDIQHTPTQITAGHLVTLQSGGNTSLTGAIVSAQRIQGDVQGQLLQSTADSSTTRQSGSQAGGSLTLGPGSVPTGGSVSAGQTRVVSDYASVNPQTRLQAGDGGFQIEVDGSTTQPGAAITRPVTSTCLCHPARLSV